MLPTFSLGLLLLRVLRIYMLILIVRVIFDLVQVFVRDWRPSGILLIIANLVNALTDPPLDFLRRYVPTVNFGGVGLDLSFLVLIVGIQVLEQVIIVLLL